MSWSPKTSFPRSSTHLLSLWWALLPSAGCGGLQPTSCITPQPRAHHQLPAVNSLPRVQPPLSLASQAFAPAKVFLHRGTRLCLGPPPLTPHCPAFLSGAALRLDQPPLSISCNSLPSSSIRSTMRITARITHCGTSMWPLALELDSSPRRQVVPALRKPALCLVHSRCSARGGWPRGGALGIS